MHRDGDQGSLSHSQVPHLQRHVIAGTNKSAVFAKLGIRDGRHNL